MKISIIILFAFLLAACGATAAELPSDLPISDVNALSTQAVATVYAVLTLSPAASVDNPSLALTPLPPAMTDKFNVPMLLVPAGPFLMGRDENAGGQPYAVVVVGNYYIDTFEVTNQRYMICVHAGACQAPAGSGSYTQANYYLDPAFADYPFISVDSSKGEAYCAWRGLHLTTEIEWEKAARGPDGRSFPWGNQPVDGTRANICDRNCNQADQPAKSLDDGYKDVSPVGSFPAGASPYGVMDMVGNVQEWVTQVGVARQAWQGGLSPAAGADETRGGAWSTLQEAILHTISADSRQYSPDVAKLDMGFRCASAPVGESMPPVFEALRPTP